MLIFLALHLPGTERYHLDSSDSLQDYHVSCCGKQRVEKDNPVYQEKITATGYSEQGNLYAASKLLVLEKPVITKRKHQGTDIVTGNNYSFWALDSWKAHNNYDDDNDGKVDFSDQDWDEAIYLVNTTAIAISQKAVFFFDRNYYGTSILNPSIALSFLDEYETVIYPAVTDITGNPPDIDDNGQLFIIVTDIRDSVYYGQQGDLTGGYFWPLHSVVNTGESIYRFSNESEIIFLDSETFNSFSQKIPQGLLAHELTHLVHYSKDDDEELWLDEGIAVYSQVACGYEGTVEDYINAFLGNTRTSLTFFDGSLSSYGVSYLFVEYLTSLFDEDILHDLVASKLTGMGGVADISGQHGGSDNSIILYTDFAATLARKENGLTATVDAFVMNSLPFNSRDTIESWSSVYMQLPRLTNLTAVSMFFTAELTTNIQSLTAFYFITLVKFNDNRFIGSDVFQVDSETASGQVILNGYGSDYDNGIIIVHLFAGTGSGNSKVSYVPSTAFEITLMVTTMTTGIMAGDLFYSELTETAIFRNLRFVDETGFEITPENGPIDSAEWAITDKNKIIQKGELSWDNTTASWLTENVSTAEFTSEFYFVAVFTSYEIWPVNGSRDFSKFFSFPESNVKDVSIMPVIFTGSVVLTVTVSAAFIIKNKRK